MTQTAERPPRFSIQVNSRARVTRDYAYFIENRLRERYRLEGVPAIIDFVARNERRRGAHVAHAARPRDSFPRVSDASSRPPGSRRRPLSRSRGRCCGGSRRACAALAGALVVVVAIVALVVALSGGGAARRAAQRRRRARARRRAGLREPVAGPRSPGGHAALKVAARFPDFPIAGGARPDPVRGRHRRRALGRLPAPDRPLAGRRGGARVAGHADLDGGIAADRRGP